jgi:hypothetical protein
LSVYSAIEIARRQGYGAPVTACYHSALNVFGSPKPGGAP